MAAKPIKVVITGASGEIGLMVSYMMAKEEICGAGQLIDLVMVENRSRMKQLRGAVGEIKTCNLTNVQNYITTDNLIEAFTDADIIFLVGGLFSAPGFSRNDVIGMNALEFKEIGLALSKVAKATVKIVVVVEPQNINLMVLSYFAPDLKPCNLTALSRVDHNRAQTMLARMLNISSDKIVHLTMWGNRSITIFPDIRHAKIEIKGKLLPAYEAIKDDFYLKYKFTEELQNREAEILKKRKTSGCFQTVAIAAVQHMRDWIHGTKPGDWTSMIVMSDGSYGIDKGLAYSFPVRVSAAGEWEIVSDLDINYYEREKLDERVNEIKAERMFAYGILELPEAKIEVQKDEEGAVDQARATKWSFGHAEPLPCSILGILEQDRLGTM
ncbi:malate dehydrogenase [Biomphalaria pfeifferi]|uniref:Malate dehydrogenase, cytoplasmic n=1 Tax=Biomphalaria pfeifferi TaxID=112525 RepID=A0AAD8F826_BIOPF|nr:malate dehydrogenase [Biomphalaria pfeifferi]